MRKNSSERAQKLKKRQKRQMAKLPGPCSPSPLTEKSRALRDRCLTLPSAKDVRDAMFIALSLEDHAEAEQFVSLILEKEGSRIFEFRDKNGNPCVHTAIRRGHSAVVRALMEAQARDSIKRNEDKKGAEGSNHAGLAQLRLRDSFGESAVQLAERLYNEEVRRMERSDTRGKGRGKGRQGNAQTGPSQGRGQGRGQGRNTQGAPAPATATATAAAPAAPPVNVYWECLLAMVEIGGITQTCCGDHGCRTFNVRGKLLGALGLAQTVESMMHTARASAISGDVMLDNVIEMVNIIGHMAKGSMKGDKRMAVHWSECISKGGALSSEQVQFILGVLVDIAAQPSVLRAWCLLLEDLTVRKDSGSSSSNNNNNSNRERGHKRGRGRGGGRGRGRESGRDRAGVTSLAAFHSESIWKLVLTVMGKVGRMTLYGLTGQADGPNGYDEEREPQLFEALLEIVLRLLLPSAAKMKSESCKNSGEKLLPEAWCLKEFGGDQLEKLWWGLEQALEVVQGELNEVDCMRLATLLRGKFVYDLLCCNDVAVLKKVHAVIKTGGASGPKKKKKNKKRPPKHILAVLAAEHSLPLPQAFLNFLDGDIRGRVQCLVSSMPEILDRLAFLLRVEGLIETSEKLEFVAHQLSSHSPGLVLTLNRFLADREETLESVIQQLSAAKPHLLGGPLAVELVGEPGSGEGPVRELLTVLTCLFMPNCSDLGTHHRVGGMLNGHLPLFEPRGTSCVVPRRGGDLKLLHAVGRIIGLCILNQCPLGVRLPLGLWFMLCDRKPSWQQNCEDEAMERSMQAILSTDFDAPSALELEFVYYDNKLGRDIPMMPGGESTAVTNQNKLKFVQFRCNMHMHGGAIAEIEAIKEGLETVLTPSLRHAFSPMELQQAFTGETLVNTQELQSVVKYPEDGFDAHHPDVMAFWDVVHGMNASSKRLLLLFWSGLKHPPIFGFAHERVSAEQDEAWSISSKDERDVCPEAIVCNRNLLLPSYSSREKLQEMIQIALNFGSEGYTMA